MSRPCFQLYILSRDHDALHFRPLCVYAGEEENVVWAVL